MSAIKTPRRRAGHSPGDMPIEKAKDFKGTLKKLASYIARYKAALLFIVIFSIGGTIFNIIGPKLLGTATTEIFDGYLRKMNGASGIDFEKIAHIILTVMLLYGISAVFTLVQGFAMTAIAQKVSFRMRKEISEKINRIPMKYFESVPHGEVLSRVTNDVDTLGSSLNQSVTALVVSVATIIGVLYMMFSISWILTVIALVILPLSGALMAVSVKKSQRYFKEQQEYLGKVNGQVEEVFGGHLVIKAFNREKYAAEDFMRDNKKLYKSALMSQFISGIMFPIMIFTGNLGYVAVAVAGARLAMSGALAVGNIQAFIQYIKHFTQPIGQLAQISSMLQSAAAAAERVFEFLEEPEEEATCEAPLKAGKISGNVSFEDVCFGYEPEKIVVNGFSAEIKEGQTVAIVGPTGAGKTTIVKLLMRFYDVNGGRILVDGQDVRHYERSEIRSAFGMVLQDTWLFKGTIMENIRYGKPNATDAEVYAAAKAAHADRFIKTLPSGYETELNEEATNVSQGQKQLLTIARAILADSAIMILDEATSSVDTRTEIRIQKAMKNLMKGRTGFVIAHRLSTIKDADLILVMRGGDIAEQGTHEELLAKQGFYSELYNSQFEQTG
ncbi:MAG: ABC transporter ATP-binding protein/permease [Oscillospiraceae bacterium]|nr:ABC transporter ATP-binding protein/permease [Oscillospiraceae bacterium]